MLKVNGYNILWNGTRWTCTCPDFRFRQNLKHNGTCKHIREAVPVPEVQDQRYLPREQWVQLVDAVSKVCFPWQHQVCGSWRRGRPTLKDLDVVVRVDSSQVPELLRRIISYCWEVKSGGDHKLTVTADGKQVDFLLCHDDKHWPTMLMHFTGSKAENIRLRTKAKSMGLVLNEYRLTDLVAKCEMDVYMGLGEEWREPWER